MKDIQETMRKVAKLVDQMYDENGENEVQETHKDKLQQINEHLLAAMLVMKEISDDPNRDEAGTKFVELFSDRLTNLQHMLDDIIHDTNNA